MGESEKNTNNNKEKLGENILKVTSDIGKIAQTLGQVKETQQRSLEIHREEVMESYLAMDKDLDEVWDEYNKNDTFHEYLVDGALLTCTQATLDPFILPDGECIELNKGLDQSEYERKQSRLDVSENGVYINNLRYATTRDTEMDVNIFPFRCNCGQKIYGASEIEYIKDHLEDCKENGVCKYLMWLNEEWDNMPIDTQNNTQGYLKIIDTQVQKSVDGKVLENEQIVTRISEGITRTSVLFCRRGGLIVPLTSGQELLLINNDYSDLNEDEILLITTIYGEANLCSEYSWKAIAHIIMNRVGYREWSQYKTPVDIIKYTGFDAYISHNNPYNEAESYFRNRDYSNDKIENMIQVVMPILRGEEEDITQNAVLYYSPKAQEKLHKSNPEKYKEVPNFASSSQTEEVKINGTENDDFKFYKYK